MSTSAGAPFHVWVKDAARKDRPQYTKLMVGSSELFVDDLKTAVLAKFKARWGERAEDDIALFLVANEGGTEEEPDAAEEARAIALASLRSTQSLAAAKVTSGSFLLAKWGGGGEVITEPGPGGPVGAVGAAGEPLAFERLLIISGLPPAHLEAPAALRARIKYGHMVVLAIMEGSHELARKAYELAKRLPSTATVESLYVEGIKMNGLLCEGSELVICYKGERVHLLKGLHEDEAARARIFHEAVGGEHVPHVTPYELVESAKGKHFMIMPKFATALEPLPYLSPAGVAMLWAHMQEALEGLHARGFAHADVKPANICLTEDGGSAFLIDLGSVARMGERTSSTPPYVPRDVPRGRASAALDWWMLAMTLAEKACGADHGLEVGGASHATKNVLRAHLAAHLSPTVWAALEPKLAE